MYESVNLPYGYYYPVQQPNKLKLEFLYMSWCLACLRRTGRGALKRQNVKISKCLWWYFQRQYFRAFKQAQRREDDITIVTTAIMLELQEHSDVVKWIRIAYGGMAPTTKMAFGTQAALRLK